MLQPGLGKALGTEMPGTRTLGQHAKLGLTPGGPGPAGELHWAGLLSHKPTWYPPFPAALTGPTADLQAYTVMLGGRTLFQMILGKSEEQVGTQSHSISAPPPSRERQGQTPLVTGTAPPYEPSKGRDHCSSPQPCPKFPW